MAKKKARPGDTQTPGGLRCRRVAAAVLAALLALGNLFATAAPLAAVSTTLVISQFQVVGSTGADEFIELHNVGSTSIDLSGHRVVYRQPFGMTDITLFSWSTSTVIPAGGYYLIAHGSGYDDSVTPDGTYNLSGAGSLGSGGGGLAIRNGDEDTGTIIDSVGYGSASNGFTETTLVSAPSSGASRQREPSATTGAAGCVDSDDNFNDFESPSSVVPRNSGTAVARCTLASTPPSGVGGANPASVNTGGTALLTVAVTPGTNPASTGITVTGDLAAIGGSATQQFYDDATNGDTTADDNTFSYNATVAVGTSAGAKSLPITIADAQARTNNASIALAVLGSPRTPIHDIQGNGHTSPLNGQTLTNVQGIVTATRSNGFYMQEPDATIDPDPNTSEGIFVFTDSEPAVGVGDAVLVGGTVVEFRPGGSGGTNNLTTTEISDPGRAVSRLSSGNPLPTPVTLAPPTISIPPAIDYYERLEGMRVQINDAVVVGPTNDFGEIPVLANGGSGSGTRTARGGIVIQPDDFNPERIILDDAIIGAANMPKVSVGTTFPGAILGVLDYSFGNFKFLPTANLPAANTTNAATRETTPLTVGANQLTVATFNVENLQPNNPQAKFDALAGIIVNNLRSPDIIALEEVQDNNGATNDTVVDATATYNQLIAAIAASGGPTTYQFRQIDPVDDQDGGQPGGNIRVGFLFRTDRGVAFVDRPGGTPTAAVGVVGGANGPALTFSPGRIDPTNVAFDDSRKPLAAEFTYNGRTLFLVANHFNSKGGDQPLFGRFQPPARPSEVQREQQATVVRAFVDDILALDPDANVIVLGDINDFQFSNVLTILEGSGATRLHTLIETLPLNEQYSYR